MIRSALAMILRFIHEQGLLLKLADRIEFGGRSDLPTEGGESGNSQPQ